MRATRTLPDGYVLGGTIRLAGNDRLKWRLSLLGLPWMVVVLAVHLAVAGLVRPRGWTFRPSDVSPALLAVAVLVVLVSATAAAIVLHEASHGLVLWVHTGARPVFGFKGWYFYTDAPGWYVGRPVILLTLVAPLILLPAVGFPIVAWAPPAVSLLTLYCLVVSGIAAIGDAYMVVFIARLPGPVIFGDEGDGPAGEAGNWYRLAESRDVEQV